MITVRITRLVRVPDLQTFRDALASLACGGTPLEARDRLVIVPTRAAAAHLLRSIEDRQPASGGALLLPDFVTPDELTSRLAERVPHDAPLLTAAEREALLGVACRTAIAEGADPPFRLRPGLIAEILRFYDTLRRNQKDVDTFERLALGMLEPGASYDRGAERLVRQTRFLVSAFRQLERQCAALGAFDEHAVRTHVRETAAVRPWTHVIVAVGDRSLDPNGLYRADWDLLSRVPRLEQLDVVATDQTVAGVFHERIRDLLPGIDEVRFAREPSRVPVLLVPPQTRNGEGTLTQPARDREEEVAGFARWVRHAVRTGDVSALDRMALVVRRLEELLAPEDAALDGFYYCPHQPGGRVRAYAVECLCRKPSPGLIEDACREHDLDPVRSWMIGDVLDDVEAGRRAGCRSIMIDSGHETAWRRGPERVPHLMAPNLLAAADQILRTAAHERSLART